MVGGGPVGDPGGFEPGVAVVIVREVSGMADASARRQPQPSRDRVRTRRVVVVDADNPLQEITGEFFWREDHEQILAVVRETAFRRGYSEGFTAAVQQSQEQAQKQTRAHAQQQAQSQGTAAHQGVSPVVYWRRFSLRRVVARALVLFVVVCFAVSLLHGFQQP